MSHFSDYARIVHRDDGSQHPADDEKRHPGRPMKAVAISKVGGPEAFEVREVPAPEPLGEQIRVRVRAAGLNRADLMQARGQYPAPPGAPADVPGLEYA